MYDSERVTVTKDFIMCEGDIPVMLVAHMDTVFKTPPKHIYFDATQQVMWSPQGLGADDRAGIFGIFKIIEEGYRPHVLLTTDEEIGGIGAQAAVMYMLELLFDTKYIVQLDRQGSYDCVFYSCANPDFKQFVEKYGFITQAGSFSDISILCPAWGLAGVNLSIGYRNEHREIETLHTYDMETTIKAVIKMLQDVDNTAHFEFIMDQDEYHFWSRYGCYAWDYPEEDDIWYNDPINRNDKKKIVFTCKKCQKNIGAEYKFDVQSAIYKNTMNYYCVDCISTAINVDWCAKCGAPFETLEDRTLCYDCGPDDRTEINIF